MSSNVNNDNESLAPVPFVRVVTTDQRTEDIGHRKASCAGDDPAAHDQYTTIVRSKPSQMVLNHPKWMRLQR
jgi:hypothetical protein